MKKLIFLTLHLNYGGVCSAIVNTANLLSKTYEVEIISIYNFNSPLKAKIDPKVQVTYLLNSNLLPNREAFLYALKHKKIIQIIQEGLISIKILFLKKSKMIQAIRLLKDAQVIGTDEFVSALLSKYGSTTLYKIAWEHHYHRNEKKYIQIIQHDYKNIDLLLLLTKQVVHEYENFLSEANNHHTQVDVMPNVLFKQTIAPSSLTSSQCLFVGRFDPIKGINRMLNIFAQIDLPWTLKLVGDGPIRQEIENTIQVLHLQDRVFLSGALSNDEALKQMQESSIFLMTSYSEGLPMVLLEAMSVGLPCISYDVKTGPADIILHEQNGYLIKDNQEADFIEYCRLLMNDESLRKRMQESCLNTATKFDEEHLIKKWNHILSK